MKNSRFLLFFLSFFICKNITYTQCFWAKKMGNGTDANATQGYGIDVDQNGNVYSTGVFVGLTDFDPGAATYNLNASGNADIYVSKLDANGNFVWAKQLGGSSSDMSYALALDASGNIYITGQFQGTADFDPGAGTFYLTSSSYNDLFVCKLNSNGNFMWAKKFESTAEEQGNSLTIDGNGNILITGDYSGTVDFDPGIGTFNLTSIYNAANFGNEEVFVLKLDNNGNFIWAKSISCVGSDEGRSITTDCQ